jgi:hypothetical protein
MSTARTAREEGLGAQAPGPSDSRSFLAIDGAAVTLRGAATLPEVHTSHASFVLPGGRRSHPFRAHRAGYADALREWTAGSEFGVEILETFERPVQGGHLRLAAVRQRTGAGRSRSLVFAAWEHECGSIVTSRHGRDLAGVARRLLTLPYRAQPGGCTLALRVDAAVRPPTVMMHVADVGVLFVRPHTAQLLARVPAARGLRSAGGELFRTRADRRTMLLVTRSAVVDIEPVADGPAALAAASALRIEWEAPTP